ncbi:MAG: hypothetical protein KFH98_04540 [Gemmatimonadetes bacterium]|nr:hypothetical protein [Gemmatimonadota bacterium]
MEVVDSQTHPPHLFSVYSHTSPAAGDSVAHASTVMRFVRVTALLIFAFWVWRYMRDTEPLLHGSLLIFHEAGHVLFMPFGEFMMVLGGSLFQLMVPAFFVALFAIRRDGYAAAFASLYLAASFAGVAIYIADARAGELPLLGGERSNHDWTFLLIEMEMLDQDTTIGWYVMRVGKLIFWASLAAGGYFAWNYRSPAA